MEGVGFLGFKGSVLVNRLLVLISTSSSTLTSLLGSRLKKSRVHDSGLEGLVVKGQGGFKACHFRSQGLATKAEARI